MRIQKLRKLSKLREHSAAVMPAAEGCSLLPAAGVLPSSLGDELGPSWLRSLVDVSDCLDSSSRACERVLKSFFI
jgi:hypothetical protein